MSNLIYPDLSYTVQGAFYDVYNELRYLELSEEGWENALLIALTERQLSAQRQVEYELRYQGYRIGRFFIDVLVDDKLLLELKVAPKLLPIDEAQVLTYLKIANLKLGILVNFGLNDLEIKRIPNFVSDRQAQNPSDDGQHASDDLLHSALTAELRSILYAIHNELGPGFMHMHYRRAGQVALRQRGVPYEVKKEINILFRDQPIETRGTRLLIVDGKVLLVLIAVRQITRQLKNRFHHYLKLLDLKLGLIANFHSSKLQIETVTL